MKNYIIAFLVIVIISLGYLVTTEKERQVYDLNSDGTVDMADASILFAHFK